MDSLSIKKAISKNLNRAIKANGFEVFGDPYFEVIAVLQNLEITQETMAAYFGITRQAISNWARGFSPAPEERYGQLLDFLELVIERGRIIVKRESRNPAYPKAALAEYAARIDRAEEVLQKFRRKANGKRVRLVR